jgi:hypothetical protein
VVGWGAFESEGPALGRLGRQLLYLVGVGIGFLATTRADGGPRVHPISPILTADALYALIIPGPKLADLRRDGRYALHSLTSPPPNQDDAFYVAGRAIETPDPRLWESVAHQMLDERAMADRWPGFENQVLFELHLERCLLTLTRARDGFPAGHTTWRASMGMSHH